jgi:ABC-type bacteriocin/lantibiotic exporter with double-glycine peptidase domain
MAMGLGWGEDQAGRGPSFRAPAVTLVVMTSALNLLGLITPLAAQLIFNRILSVPGSATLPIIVAVVTVLAVAEAGLRLARSYLLLDANRVFTAHLTRELIGHMIASARDAGQRGPAQCLQYFLRIAQKADKFSGALLVGFAELLFVPLIALLIFQISPMAGVLVLICLVVAFRLSFTDMMRLRRTSIMANRRMERRYRFLLTTLGALHGLKALAIEDRILRHYEALQQGLTRSSMAGATIGAGLINGTTITNQVMTGVILAYGAYAVNEGTLTLGAISAIVLLANRLLTPVQRAVLIVVQSRDLGEAERTLCEAFALPPMRTAAVAVPALNEGRLRARGVEISAGAASRQRYRAIDLDLDPGEVVTLSGASEAACSQLLRTLGGIEPPLAGDILLNGVALADYPQGQLNQHVAYVPSVGAIFSGTIRDNITRFGEVTTEAALSVAAIMELQPLIDELPRGLDTPVTGGTDDVISASLRQQIAIVRALALRPRLLLLDHADRGLDREGYARLQRFLARVAGQVTILIASDDRNLAAGARRGVDLTPAGLAAAARDAGPAITPYRILKP